MALKLRLIRYGHHNSVHGYVTGAVTLQYTATARYTAPGAEAEDVLDARKA